MPGRIPVLLIVLLAGIAAMVGLAVAACGSGSLLGGSTGDIDLEFSAETLDGKPFSGQSLDGRPAVLWFWAPWCRTCQREAPTVARVVTENPNVTFVGVAGHGELGKFRAFVDKYGAAGFTQLADPDSAVWAHFRVGHQPAYAFVSPNGHVEVVRGPLGESELADRVRALTGE